MDKLYKAIVVVILIGILAVLVWTTIGKNKGMDAIAHFPTIETQEQFKELVLDEPGVVLLDIYTDQCSFCHKLAPELADLEKRYEGRVKFMKLDAKNAQDLATMHRIRGVPTMVIYAGGQDVDQFDGYMPADAIAVRLDQALASAGGD